LVLQRFLDPQMLHGISSLELIARTVVDGFVTGLHKSPDFGFSQEFAEYRAYTPGDDLRHVDWNLFARTERCYLKRYRGETNSQLTILLDASNSMKFSSHSVTKMDYARYIAASLFYLSIHNQRDPAGLIVFDDEVRNYIRPSTRSGQLYRLMAGLEQAEPAARTDFAKPLKYFQEFLRRRGIVLVVSDFYEEPEIVVKAIEPLRFHGSEVVLFHILDPTEIYPDMKGPSILLSPAHHRQAARSGADRVPHAAPGGDVMGFLAPWFLGGLLAVGLPVFVHLLRRQTTVPKPVSSLMFFEQGTQSSTRHRRLRYYLLFALRTLLVLLLVLVFAQPFFRHKSVLASDRLLLVVVDDSYSMNAAAGPGETKLDEAKRGALEVLAGRAPAQKAQVIALGGQMRVLTQPVEDAGALRRPRQLRRAGPRHAGHGRDRPYAHGA
jgi:hypothetical protein